MKWIKSLFKNFSEPQLKARYSIFFKDQLLALLDEPVNEDQFWVSFRLTPKTSEPELLVMLYDDQSWETKFDFKESDTLKTVEFLLQRDIEEQGEELHMKSSLASRPTYVTLRGPYNASRNQK